ALGSLKAGADRATVHVHGARPDGTVVAQVSAGTPRRPCLALLDTTRDLAPVRTDCATTLGADGRGAVSPDGRWLLVNGRATGRDTSLLVDLDRLGTPAAVRPAGPPLPGAVAWTPRATAVYADASGALVWVDVGRVLAGERATLDPADALRSSGRPVPVTGAEF
ncbi:hypothetical protein NCC78_30120, partial [Micromonospora phytophila]|nr:hypothetical protein [Micromonospora phytophila]